VLDRLLAGPGFLDTGGLPQIAFRSALLVWVPAGRRAVGRLQVKNAQHELACQLDLDLPDTRPGGPQRVIIATSWVNRLPVGNQLADPGSRPPQHDDVLIFHRTGYVSG
jgi:hypothetical protein